MFNIYLKMRKPTPTPKARTHIPISNGGQLQMTETKSTGYQLRGYKFNGPFFTRKDTRGRS